MINFGLDEVLKKRSLAAQEIILPPAENFILLLAMTSRLLHVGWR